MLLTSTFPYKTHKTITTAIYYSLKHTNINHKIINILNIRQHVSAIVGHHQAKLEQSLSILNVRTLWDPTECTHPIYQDFVLVWPDGGPLRPKYVA